MTPIRRRHAMCDAAAIGSGNSRAGSVALIAGVLGLALVLAAPSALAADCKSSAEPGIDWSHCDRSNLMLSGVDLAGA
ncbi:MAG: hypothetical protein ABJF67_04595, partial [Aurantimonas coralicida]